jgi:hypothetical protein
VTANSWFQRSAPATFRVAAEPQVELLPLVSFDFMLHPSSISITRSPVYAFTRSFEANLARIRHSRHQPMSDHRILGTSGTLPCKLASLRDSYSTGQLSLPI